MKIFIVGVDSQADFVVSSFKGKGNQLVIMNEDKEVAKTISEDNGVDVLTSPATKTFSLEEAEIEDFDLVVSLLERDVDNFVVCALCKKLFRVKKAICTVHNPNSVEVFKELGIDSPISDTYLLTERIRGESDVESIIKTLTLENEKVAITEVTVKPSFICVGKNLKDLGLPRVGNVCCIFRKPSVIIPRGDTVIASGDTLIIASGKNNQQEIVDFLKKGRE